MKLIILKFFLHSSSGQAPLDSLHSKKFIAFCPKFYFFRIFPHYACVCLIKSINPSKVSTTVYHLYGQVKFWLRRFTTFVLGTMEKKRYLLIWFLLIWRMSNFLFGAQLDLGRLRLFLSNFFEGKVAKLESRVLEDGRRRGSLEVCGKK